MCASHLSWAYDLLNLGGVLGRSSRTPPLDAVGPNDQALFKGRAGSAGLQRHHVPPNNLPRHPHKLNSRNSVSTILHSPGPIRVKNVLWKEHCDRPTRPQRHREDYYTPRMTLVMGAGRRFI